MGVASSYMYRCLIDMIHFSWGFNKGGISVYGLSAFGRIKKKKTGAFHLSLPNYIHTKKLRMCFLFSRCSLFVGFLNKKLPLYVFGSPFKLIVIPKWWSSIYQHTFSLTSWVSIYTYVCTYVLFCFIWYLPKNVSLRNGFQPNKKI